MTTHPESPDFAGDRVAGLTPRELDVVRLVTNGCSNAEIAETLGLGVTTVKTHIRAAYRKIGVDRRTHAVLWGVSHGLLDPRIAEQQMAAIDRLLALSGTRLLEGSTPGEQDDPSVPPNPGADDPDDVPPDNPSGVAEVR